MELRKVVVSEYTVTAYGEWWLIATKLIIMLYMLRRSEEDMTMERVDSECKVRGFGVCDDKQS